MANSTESNHIVRFGEFVIDLRTGELRSNGHHIILQEKPFQILTALLERPGEMVTREELIKRLWPAGTFVDFDLGLNKAVNRLREALEDSAEQPRFIETFPKRGYRLVAEVIRNGAGPAKVSPTSPAQQSKNVALAVGVLRWRSAVAAGLLAIIVMVSYFAWRRHSRAPAPTGRIMMAVLPFQNLTGDPEQEYLTDGLTEETIARLGGLQPERLGIIARTSVMGYKHGDKRLDQIGRELDVQYVLEGSVRRDRNRLRITAQLIQVKDQSHLWAQEYDRSSQDIIALQDDVAAGVTQEI
jgi:TolB-like protein/DNA-binding winged helix-turn-helix (wHTH) protein